jgi:tetratricopeptide (TPR) repeat protein
MFRLSSRNLILVASFLSAAAISARADTAAVQPAETPSDQAVFQEFKCVTSFLAFEYETAQTACSAAIALTPDSPFGYKFRGFNYLLQHQYARAEPDFRTAVRLDPKDADNQAGYAQALNGQGRFTEAVERFGIALQLAPHDVRYLSARCWARAGQGQELEKALADCNLALKLVPGFAVAYDSRALVYLRLHNYAQSFKDYSQSLVLAPDRATAYFGRGFAEFHLGQAPAAKADIALARRVDPEVDDIFIQVGIMSASCKSASGPCELPDYLKPHAPDKNPSQFIMVSYRPAATKHVFAAEAIALDPSLADIVTGLPEQKK